MPVANFARPTGHLPAVAKPAHTTQSILNMRPAPPRGRQIDGRRARLHVRARVEWSNDGEQWVDAVMEARTSSAAPSPVVLVSITDPRAQRKNIWLPAEDIQR